MTRRTPGPVGQADPLPAEIRAAHYLSQTGRTALTARQRRRHTKKRNRARR